MEANTVAKSEAGGVCHAEPPQQGFGACAETRRFATGIRSCSFGSKNIYIMYYNVISRRARHIEQLHIAITVNHCPRVQTKLIQIHLSELLISFDASQVFSVEYDSRKQERHDAACSN